MRFPEASKLEFLKTTINVSENREGLSEKTKKKLNFKVNIVAVTFICSYLYCKIII